jgi:S-DNA-T family DNA segregation ATPase FtsK/SpoIIIE
MTEYPTGRPDGRMHEAEDRRHLHAVDTPPDGVPTDTNPDTTIDAATGQAPGGRRVVTGEVVPGSVTDQPLTQPADQPGGRHAAGGVDRDGGADERLLGEDERGTTLSAGHAPVLPAVPGQRGGPVDAHVLAVPARGLGQRLAEAVDAEARPVLPEWVKDRQVLAETAGRVARAAGHRALYRSVRSPIDALRILWFAAVGARRLGWRAIRWGFDVDGHPLIGDVVAADDRAYVRMASDRTMRQKWRLSLLAVLTLVMLAGVHAARWWAPWWVLPLAFAAAVVGFARHGKPTGTKLISPAVVRDVRVPLTSPAIVEALSVLGISVLTKSLQIDSTKIWRSDIVAVRGGHQVEIKLPSGVLATDLVPHEQRMAHALDRQADCVIVEPLAAKTPGHLLLHVLDRPALVGMRGPGPLAKARKTSWFNPVNIGVNRIGKAFTLHLRGGAWFIGGQPASGKSSLLRIAAAHTALDPHAMLTVINLKGNPSYVALKPICHRYLSGAPETDRLIIARAIAVLRELLADTAARNDFLTRLVESGKAESDDVTEDLARAHALLRPHTVILDEFHRLFDPSVNPDIDATEELLGNLIKACRSAGITLVLATQLAGTESIPPGAVRAARVRGCLTVQDEVSFRQIFGNTGRGAYADSGVNSLAPGTVILKAEDGAAVKVGTWFIDLPHMTAIGKRALALRSDLKLLSGDAVGDTMADPADPIDPADLLRHVLAEIPTTAPTGGPTDTEVAWIEELEGALSERTEYRDRAPGWLAPELRARKVATPPINRRTPDGPKDQRTTAGVRAAGVRAALEALLTE